MYYEKHPHLQWRQRECNFGGDTEGIKEQLQRLRKTVPFIVRQRWEIWKVLTVVKS